MHCFVALCHFNDALPFMVQQMMQDAFGMTGSLVKLNLEYSVVLCGLCDNTSSSILNFLQTNQKFQSSVRNDGLWLCIILGLRIKACTHPFVVFFVSCFILNVFLEY